MRLRVLDFGQVGPLRSQAVYHGLAEAMGADDDPILVLVRPDAPYLCIGLHQDPAAELDLDACAALGLPVLRRHVGGGTVLLDQRQLFFHFVFPRRLTPGPVRTLYPRLLAPVLSTYRNLGLPAELREPNDIIVGGRKIGGTGAATIGQANLVVGSFLYDFDSALMARCLRLPSPGFRADLETALAQGMTTLARELAAPPSMEELRHRFLQRVAADLRLRPEPDRPRELERAAIAEAERELNDPEWLAGEGGRRLVPHGVKIAAGVYLTERRHPVPGGTLSVRLLARHGRIARLRLYGPDAPGLARLARRLAGLPLRAEALGPALAAALRERSLHPPAPDADALVRAILATAHQEPP